MQRTLGLFLIMFSCAGLGISESLALTRRMRALEMCRRMAELIKGEIRFGNASLHDAFISAADKLPGVYREFMRAVAEEMNGRRNISFGEIFRKCAEQYLNAIGLEKEEKEAVFSMGGHLGYLDLEMQMKELLLYEQELSYFIEKLRRELPAKKKVYQSLGILGGIMLAVLVW